MLSWFARRRPAAPTPRAPLFRLARLYALTSAVIGEYLWEERALATRGRRRLDAGRIRAAARTAGRRPARHCRRSQRWHPGRV